MSETYQRANYRVPAMQTSVETPIKSLSPAQDLVCTASGINERLRGTLTQVERLKTYLVGTGPSASDCGTPKASLNKPPFIPQMQELHGEAHHLISEIGASLDHIENLLRD